MKLLYTGAFLLMLLATAIRTKADIIIQTTDVTHTPGTEFTIPIVINGASEEGTPISSANIVFIFDTAAVQFMQFQNFNPLTPQSQWFFSGNNNTGIVAANWLEPNLDTVAVPDGYVLYNVKFKAKPGACPFTFITYEFTDYLYNEIPTTPDHGSYASIQQVTFRVNLRDQSVSPDGVHLAGTFNGWSTSATLMTAGDSTIYSVTVPLISDSLYYFRYVNGNASPGYEIVPSECGVPSGNDYNRSLLNPGGDTTLPAICFSGCNPCPPLTNITFQVNMRDQNVSPQGVHLAGSFNSWSTSSTLMTLSDEAIYSVTLELLEDSIYIYKFVNGNTTAGYESVPSACGVPYGNDYARSVTVPVSETTLPDVCFASCDTCPPQAQVTFRVDMSDQNISADGIHIAGTFNNWSPSATLMNNLGNDIFGVTLPIVTGTDVEYRFVNGNTTAGYEVVPSNCGVPASGGLYNRFLNVPESDTTLTAVCFSNCSECLTLRSVTFKVDMGEENVSPDGVHIAGSFNGFNPGSYEMINQGNDVFLATLDLFENELATYRFVNGADASGFETVPEVCGLDNGSGIFNRYLTVPQQDTIIPEVCFGSCEDCEQQPWEKEVTFRVDMSKEIVSQDGIQLAGTFNGWDTGINPMIHQGNNIYSATLTLNENDVHQYRFVNGNTTAGYETVPEECGVSGTSGGLERQLTVPVQDTILPAVCFAACIPCVSYQVTLQVDMMLETISVFGIHIAGSFNNWDPSANELINTGFSVYEATLQIYEGDTLIYRFVNGNQSPEMESVPSECGWNYNGSDYARYIMPVSDTILEPICFSWCDPCDIGVNESNGSVLIGKPFPNPSGSKVNLPVNINAAVILSVVFYNMTGIVEMKSVISLAGGYHEVEFPVNELSEGLHFIRIEIESPSGTMLQTEKLMVIH